MDKQQEIKLVYQARKGRLVHPQGHTDNGGRWYPSAEEDADGFTAHLRAPTRSWPWSYMVGARTRKHVAALADANPAYFRQLVEEAHKALAALTAKEAHA